MRSSLISTPGMSFACRRRDTTPARVLEMVTSSDSARPPFKRIRSLLARACLYSDPGCGPCKMSGRIPPAPLDGPGELVLPNGVSLTVSESIYQYHCPATTFHSVFTGIDK